MNQERLQGRGLGRGGEKISVKARGLGSALSLRSSSGTTWVSPLGPLGSWCNPWVHQQKRGAGTNFAQGQLFPVIWEWEMGFFPSPLGNEACELKCGICFSLLP